ncbi:hypothetical protein D5S18_02565 [Nocardia panacis]|uniref:DUF2231 domain-containing protein n=1 Tax=Nocardia panacis TaxID=2340916 RepID=A0A3A4KPL6_9NOCA|nr:DUF2231 domain-containing protein [Nocardia panacis]RJO79432.1 hypothetical protein D5S18_02565 [Nocardia panacis]
MSTLNGLPAHVLLVHAVVVLIPLTAALLILCALWRAARSRLSWLVAVLALGCLILTPITIRAGEWFENRLGNPPDVRHHADLGATMTYFAVALFVGALLVLLVHWRESRGKSFAAPIVAVLAVLAIAAGVAATWQVYRVGDSGAHAVWGDRL